MLLRGSTIVSCSETGRHEIFVLHRVHTYTHTFHEQMYPSCRDTYIHNWFFSFLFLRAQKSVLLLPYLVVEMGRHFEVEAFVRHMCSDTVDAFVDGERLLRYLCKNRFELHVCVCVCVCVCVL